jgi:hypothetical protein
VQSEQSLTRNAEYHIFSRIVGWRFTIENIRSSARHIQQKFVTYLLLWSTDPQISYLYAYVSFVHHFTNTLLRVFKKESVGVNTEFWKKNNFYCGATSLVGHDLAVIEVSRSDSDIRNVNSPTQRPLPNNTQHSLTYLFHGTESFLRS